METIKQPSFVGFQTAWHKLRQENFNHCFEIYDEENQQYDRITGMDYGRVHPSLFEAIKNWSKGSSLTFHMAVNDEGQFFPFFEFNSPNKTRVYSPENKLTGTFISSNQSKYKAHYGVSADYKNEVCTNWALLPYYMVSRIFFQTINLDGTSSGSPDEVQKEFLKRPKRVKKFIIQDEDIDAMSQVLNEDSFIRVHFGVNYGHSANQQIAFTPVIEISNTSWDDLNGDGDDEESTCLDFVHACPPNCPD